MPEKYCKSSDKNCLKNSCEKCGAVSVGLSDTCANCGAELKNKDFQNIEVIQKPSEITIEVEAEEIK